MVTVLLGCSGGNPGYGDDGVGSAGGDQGARVGAGSVEASICEILGQARDDT